jgi:hypothetical protein
MTQPGCEPGSGLCELPDRLLFLCFQMVVSTD